MIVLEVVAFGAIVTRFVVGTVAAGRLTDCVEPAACLAAIKTVAVIVRHSMFVAVATVSLLPVKHTFWL